MSWQAINALGDVMLAWKAASTALHGIAIGSTAFRINYRYRHRQLWWDDCTVLVPLTMECLYVAVLWLRVQQEHGVSLETKIVYYWLHVVAFQATLWGSRLSLALAIARIFPSGAAIRRYMIVFTYACGLVFAVLLSARLAVCIPDPSWQLKRLHPFPSCKTPKAVNIVCFAVDIAADLILFACPLRVLWHVRLPRSQRRLVLAIFSASIWTVLISVMYLIIVFGPWAASIGVGTLLREMTSHVLSAIALMVCNVPVVVTFIYRTLRSPESIDDTITTEGDGIAGSSGPGSSRPTTLVLTEISDYDFSFLPDSMSTFDGRRSRSPSPLSSKSAPPDK